MTEKRNGSDRRSEPRSPKAGRVTWRRTNTRTVFSGWLSDQGLSNVSFVSSARTRPATGDEIEVIGPDRSRRRYCIARIAPYDEHLSLIACRGNSSAAAASR